jgi:hypothetical protein
VKTQLQLINIIIIIITSLTSELDEGQRSVPRPGRSSPWQEPNTPRPVWTVVEKRKPLSFTGILVSGHSVRDESVYRLGYPNTPPPPQLNILYIFPESKKVYFKVCCVDENCALLWYYAASSGKVLLSFRFEFTTTIVTELYSYFLSLFTM